MSLTGSFEQVHNDYNDGDNDYNDGDNDYNDDDYDDDDNNEISDDNVLDKPPSISWCFYHAIYDNKCGHHGFLMMTWHRC